MKILKRLWWNHQRKYNEKEAGKCNNTALYFYLHGERELAESFLKQKEEHLNKAISFQNKLEECK